MNHQHAKIWSFLEWNVKTISNIRNKHYQISRSSLLYFIIHE